jgi:serine/threonine protein kinase
MKKIKLSKESYGSDDDENDENENEKLNDDNEKKIDFFISTNQFNEVKNASLLNHKYILKIIKFFTENIDGSDYLIIIMPFCNSGDLLKFIKKRKSFLIESVFFFFLFLKIK